MGREIRRVPLDFAWPLHTRWDGFCLPVELRSTKCFECDGEGLNVLTCGIAASWYHPVRFSGLEFNLEQADVQALVDANRLMDFTHTWSKETGYVRREYGYVPSAQEVNAWARCRGVGHDSVNRWVVIEAKAKRLGVYGLCATCNGAGEIWNSPEQKAEAEAWDRTDPPTGEGWQLWETVSEGSPISPVFASAEELAAYLSTHDCWGSNKASYEQWMKTIAEGWSPTFITETIPGQPTVLKEGFEA